MRFTQVLTVIVLTTTGCSTKSGVRSSSEPSGNRRHADAAAGDARTSPQDATKKPSCHGPGYAGAPAQQSFTHLSAVVVDAAGKPVSGVIAQACGTNICLNGTTRSDGSVDIDNKPIGMTKPAFKYGGGQEYAKFALALTDETVDIDLGKQVTFAFDPPAMGAPLVPGGTATSRGFSVTLSADADPVAPDPFDFDTPDLKKFRAVEVPIEKAPAAVDSSLDFGMVVALTPAATVLCPAATLTVPNSPGWPAGSRVEVFLHGVDVGEEWAPYGGWARVSGGAVSADGKTIMTDPDGGIPALSVIGIKLAP
jgi:hypothetical protein